MVEGASPPAGLVHQRTTGGAGKARLPASSMWPPWCDNAKSSTLPIHCMCRIP